MWRPSVVSILSLLFFLYISHSIWTLYTLFHPKTCDGEDSERCLKPAIVPDAQTGVWPLVQLRVYVSNSANSKPPGTEIYRQPSLNIDEAYEKKVEIQVPERTRKNGTLFVHCFLMPADFSATNPFDAPWNLVQSAPLTRYMVPQAATFQLMGDADDGSGKDKSDSQTHGKQHHKPMTHLRSILPIGVVNEALSFDWREIPGEVSRLLRVNERHLYYPIFYLDELSFRVKDLVKIDQATERANVTVSYRPVSIGKLRLLVTALHSLEQLRALGFTDKDMDEVKGIFTDTNFYFLALTVFVAAIHILLDLLAFKNDISFWRGRKTMVGLSTRTLLWRCFSQVVIFFYLLDQQTSLLVLIPAGIGALIEFWKVKKAFKISMSIVGGIPRIRFGTPSADEVQTEQFDSQGMHYLVLLLVPLCLGGAGYSLLYVPHKSWYSWFIECLANGVYAFGFLFMLPQLFVNYKLKSVAHLPWRAFMYKAFNTFIDDLFAFIITMPTAHRVACFRDDVVFVIYLYQRYLYPVDKARVNEFGETFEDAAPTPVDAKRRKKNE
uniref:Lipid scramblase CLPTM1L n=1 Tax=Plectus sambesii TaxID=2011161 RepID=A0A914VFC9_9BILA